MVRDLILAAIGAAAVIAVLLSALRTVVVPRDEQVWLVRIVFVVSGWVFRHLARLPRSEEAREAMLARHAPFTLLGLPFVWAVGVILGFSALFAALGVEPYREALVLSGSSFTTLGFSRTNDLAELELAILEALLGLGLIALLISYLPALYGAFSRREALVARFEIRAGAPPTPEALLVRAHRIGWLDHLDDLWVEWEQWFVEVEEAHTTSPALNFFRSPTSSRSWITTAGAVLDSAAIVESSVAVPSSAHAMLCLRAGYVSLRRVADHFHIPYDADPLPSDGVSIERSEFDEMYERLVRAGLPMKPDREQAWKDYAGWRVNYDAVLLGICRLVQPPWTPWSSDRAGSYQRPPMLRMPGRSSRD
ncbi:MAG: hypothetical protein KDB21_03940 [Acidimicrobiales bacterium]|nr:hypothetical protein [Acidimicrobiales bacterium]